MKRMIKYPSTPQFPAVIAEVKHATQVVGFDENTGKPVYDLTRKLPVIKARATEKIHGTNGAVCYSRPDGFWVQSRERIITPESDNAACAFYAEQNKKEWISLIEELAFYYEIDLNHYIISVYFEWCGGGIQKKSAVSSLDKRAILFQHFSVSGVEKGEDHIWWYMTRADGQGVDRKHSNIYNICNLLASPYYPIEIDFNSPGVAQNQFIDLVNQIETSSPVGESFGVMGNVGEGVVATFDYNGKLYRFKVKGDKHTESNVKMLRPVDNERTQRLQDVAYKLTPAFRLEQAFAAVNDTLNGGSPSLQRIGDFLKWVSSDILREESHLLGEEQVEPKEIMPFVAKLAKTWYFEHLNKVI